LGRAQGFYEGHQAGRMIGYVEGVNSLKPAISDGLRHGSPVCGSAMQNLKELADDFISDEELADLYEQTLMQ
jgi:hypothetical protein